MLDTRLLDLAVHILDVMATGVDHIESNVAFYAAGNHCQDALVVHRVRVLTKELRGIITELRREVYCMRIVRLRVKEGLDNAGQE